MTTVLRVFLAAALLLGPAPSAWAQRIAIPSAVAGVRVLALPATPVAPLDIGNATLRNPFPLSAPVARVMAPVAASPIAVDLALPRTAAAGLASAGSVERHPVLEVLNTLQRAGVALPEALDGPADAARLRQAAEALPPGGARDSILKLADAAATPPGLARQFALDQLFENGVRPAVPTAAPMPSLGFWDRLARFPLLPAPVRRLAEERASAKAPKPEPASPDAYKVRADRLRWVPDAGLLEQAQNLPKIEKEIVGQDLGLEALRWGLRMEGKGHNVILTGPDGAGRETAVRHILAEVAPKLATPNDLVSVTNFENQEQPLVLEVPAGNGPALEKGLSELFNGLRQTLPLALNTGPAAAQKKAIHDAYEQQAAARETEFKEAIGQTRLAGGRFGLYVQPQQDGEGRASLAIAPTFQGQPVPKGAEKEHIQQSHFTQQEWDQAQAELQQVAQQVMTHYVRLAEQTAHEHAAAHQQMSKIDDAAALEVVSALGSGLRSLVSTPAPHDDARHAELDKRAKQLMEEYRRTNGSRQIGPFLAVIRMAQTPMGTLPMPQLNKDGQPVTQELLEGMLASGELTPESWGRLQQEIKAFAGEYRKGLARLAQQLAVEHQALHANDPAPTAAERRADEWVRELLSRVAAAREGFLPQREEGGHPLAKMMAARRTDPTEAFRVKTLATNAPGGGAPVIFERTPTFENLMGSVQDSQRVMMVPGAGMVKADSEGGPMLKAGSFIRANGGFLVLDLMDVLREPGAWQALMRAVRTGQAEIAEGGVSGVLLGRSEKRYAVQAKVKVVLIGSPALKMMLAEHDPDFKSHFKAEAQFESAMDITLESVAGTIQFLRRLAADATSGVLELTRDAIVEVLQYSARKSGSNEKLSARFKPILDLVAEATYWAKEAGRAQVTGADVATAIRKRWDFEGRMRRRMQEGYWKDVFHIQTEGAAVGQINALTVYGGEFGVPTRATVVVEAGKNGVTGLDRNAGWSGPSYIKGLETLKSFLAHEFGQEKPLPFEVRVSKEQLYGGIDGDSSTSTNIYATLSALSKTPIKQAIAITGSSDQFGNVQAIGGVNQKIEGYFDVLTAKLKAAGKELDGSHGVIIPATNIPELMLRQDIVDAIKAGKFNVWGVTDVRQGIEILTGVAYPEIKRRIDERADAVRKGRKAPVVE
ncbi:MAG: AAA family ATPase [Elusimicrobia bacterium]|nr:AAA family ATPase [Elusimicrobiota bacterium]